METVTPPGLEPFNPDQCVDPATRRDPGANIAAGLLVGETLAIWTLDEGGGTFMYEGMAALGVQDISTTTPFRFTDAGILTVYNASTEETERVRNALREAFPNMNFPDEMNWDLDQG